jgi:preprotein translocase subunit Sss1
MKITPKRCIEWFVVANLAFLGGDISIAHAENAFERRVEWAPVIFSAIATLLLLPMAFGKSLRNIEKAVAAGAIIVGVLGMVFHLESAFFEQQTIRNLVYSAPFVAPLSYVGVGLLLLLLQFEDADSAVFGWWIVVLTIGGFLGNFALSLLDHAQNGFFRWTEWIPVISAAYATSFLVVAAMWPEPRFTRFAYGALALAALVGVIGFALHVAGDVHTGAPLRDRFLFGAPPFAPLLFTNLALLGAIGLWVMRRAHLAREGSLIVSPVTANNPLPR